MVIYPVPATVAQAKIQLVIDETARQPATVTNCDVQALIKAQRQAGQQALIDVKAQHHACGHN